MLDATQALILFSVFKWPHEQSGSLPETHAPLGNEFEMIISRWIVSILIPNYKLISYAITSESAVFCR